MADLSTPEGKLVEELEEEAQRLSGHSLDRGSVDAGIASNLASEAADTISRLVAARDGRTTLFSVIADIREASGLGARPMLSELAGEIGAIAARASAAERERDELKAEVERLREALKPFAGDSLPGNNRDHIEYDRFGLRRLMSNMEIARRNAFFALYPEQHPLARAALAEKGVANG